ncbi:ubiquitin carboxyl-terminal hydrolase 4-like [Tigriopus californicus]|uniref:ubiquitin carboxyl-terminal hydrolase 4-like n=1 Tax=Tigriopus californicus TaxID=6832 RepID=UPI0027DA8CFC|nr:ubiquitin carboxyl-terminal hydrolase 4-like [Tigriopus californicus]
MGVKLLLEPAEREALKSQVEKWLKMSMQTGQFWYLVDARWYKAMLQYLKVETRKADSLESDADVPEDEADPPGPMDNSAILIDPTQGELRPQLMENFDYNLVPEDMFEALKSTFGLVMGQTGIRKAVIEHGMFVKHCKVEVYPFDLHLADLDDEENVKKINFSKADTLKQVEEVARKTFEIDENVPIRLWSKYHRGSYDLLQTPDISLHALGIYSNQLVIVERQNADKTWPRGEVSTDKDNDLVTPASLASPSVSGAKDKAKDTSTVSTVPTPPLAPVSTRYRMGTSDDNASDRAKPGLCGLSNLGNTCFMNSIIQGLSNCPPVTEYFANDNYIEDINEENPLGMKGEVANSFGELIKHMWSGRYSYIVPRNFKMVVGRFAPQFSGYQQQDSQELLIFLLDGLHEDLNRIKRKPYIELKDRDNRTDEEVAAEAWETHKKRNDSVLSDLLHGLLKSTVVCPQCPEVSVKFDPYCFLSLPLPVKKERKIDVFLVYLDPLKCPKQFKVTVPKNGCMKDLCAVLAQMSDVNQHQMVVTDVYNHRFHKIYWADEALSHILDRDDIFVYEVPTQPSATTTDPDTVILPVYLRERKSSTTYSPSNLFGQPLLVGVPRENCNYEQLYEIVLDQMARYVTKPPVNNPDGSLNVWWKPKPKEDVDQNGVSSNGTASNGIPNGESEETTPSSEGESSILPSNAEVSDAQGDDEESMEDEDDNKGPPKMFVMNVVNSYGNATLDSLENDGKPLSLTSKTYLSLDWNKYAKEMFYNEKASEEFNQDDSFDAKPTQKKQHVKLEECLELYTSVEKLGANDAWYCPSCKAHQQATKKFDLWSLPGLLVISLKRFSYNRYWRDKLDTFVEFPTKGLEMSKYVINKNHGKAIYDLLAVSNHYGGMGGGHYTAYAKNKDDGQWYYFDDCNVIPSSEEAVVTKAAYVLFYQRRDLSNLSRSTPIVSSSPMSNGNGYMANGEASSVEDMEIN